MYGRFAMGCWLRRQVEKQYRLRTDRFPVIPPCIWLGVFLGSSGQLSRCTAPPAMAKYSSGWFRLHNQHVGFARTFAPRTSSPVVAPFSDGLMDAAPEGPLQDEIEAEADSQLEAGNEP